MIYHELLLCITVFALILAQANADPVDPLNPSQLGESMSMPLPQKLLQDGKIAGAITESDPLYKSDNVNATGAWSFDLKGCAVEQMKLYLIQNEDVILGQGFINSGNGTENATASGSISGDKLNLTVMPAGVLNQYKLNLSLSNLSAGTYTACMADGSNWSGKVTFTVSSNIFA